MAITWTLVAKAVGVAAAIGAGVLVWRFGYFAAPFAWTDEPQRLAAALGVAAGATVADVGAGDGAMAVAMASLVGEGGRVYATELSADRRAAIAGRVGAAGAVNVQVVAAAENTTGLPPSCCDAAYLRTVFHHIGDRVAFAAALAEAVRPGGRAGVIDFAPGTLWLHGADHGVTPDDVEAAFLSAGWRLTARADAWGGGMFLRVFERAAASVGAPQSQRLASDLSSDRIP